MKKKLQQLQQLQQKLRRFGKLFIFAEDSDRCLLYANLTVATVATVTKPDCGGVGEELREDV